MSDVVRFVSVSVSVSADGFSAGPSDDLTRPHRWMDNETDADREGGDELTRDFTSAGAIVFGRRTYDAGQGPWEDEEVFHAPVFVATHEPLPPATKNGTTFTFVNGKARDILDQARTAAGDRDVVIMGSANVAQQFLREGLVDVITLPQAPELLGAGTRLFADLDAPVALSPEPPLARRGVQLQRFQIERSA
jgi:dihydrofolate reductase